MNGRTILALGSAASVALACGTTRLDAGSNGDGGTADAAPQGLPWLGKASNSFEEKCDLPAPDRLAGAWQGEFDSNVLPSGSKAVRIAFTGAYGVGNNVCGTVTFGAGQSLPVATDPQAAPPGGTDVPTLTEIVEGFPYEFQGSASSWPLDAGVSGEVYLRLGITLNQIYKSWCNLQLSYEQFDPSAFDPLSPPRTFYNCTPRGTVTPGSSNGRLCDLLYVQGAASCAQALYCFAEICTCYGGYYGPITLIPPPEQGCTVVPRGGTSFDLSVAGTILFGNVVLPASVEGLHLTRVP